MKKLFLLITLLLSTHFLKAQLVTLGSDSLSSLYGPMFMSSPASPNKNSWNLSIYKYSEIVAAGGGQGMTISSLGWFKTTNGGYLTNDGTLELYIKTTPLSDFSGGAGNFNAEVTGSTLVYSNNAVGLDTAKGWKDYVLTTPYQITDTNNIMVLTHWSRVGAHTAQIEWLSSNYTPIRVSHYFNTSNTSGTSFYTNAKRPNLHMNLVPVGIKEPNAALTLQLLPNPVKNTLQIQLSDAQKEYQINLYDLMGKSVLSTASADITTNLVLPALPKGMYIVQVKTADIVLTKKLFIEQD